MIRLLVPYVGLSDPRHTAWHPTESTGSFSVLCRGEFETRALAEQWAAVNIPGSPFECVGTETSKTLQDLIAQVHGAFDENADSAELFAAAGRVTAIADNMREYYEAVTGQDASVQYRAIKLIAELLTAKASASHYRAAGRITVALRHEAKAEARYAALPAAWKW